MLSLNAITVRLVGLLILDGASAALPPGSRVGLVGRNGAGKSTLMRVVAGLLEADEGAAEMPRAARIGYIAQETPAGQATPFETVLGYVGAAATKSIALGLIILATAALFVPIEIQHPFWMAAFLVLIAVTFCLFGFIIGIWGQNFEQIQFVPMLIVTPLTFLGGAFYSIAMLPEPWRTITLFNPVVYLISGFRWSFYGVGDVDVGISLIATLAFLFICLGIVGWMFRTGYRLKT